MHRRERVAWFLAGAGTILLMGAQVPLTPVYREIFQGLLAGLNVTGGGAGGSLTVSSGKAIGLEGQTGDTYTKRDFDKGTIDLYKDGTLTTQVSETEWSAPLCSASGPGRAGSFCYDASTGQVKYRDAGGVKALP